MVSPACTPSARSESPRVMPGRGLAVVDESTTNRPLWLVAMAGLSLERSSRMRYSDGVMGLPCAAEPVWLAE